MNLTFLYRKPDGEEVEATLSNWRESGRYLVGFNPEIGMLRTYRKDRVVQYHNDCDKQLDQPFIDPPPIVKKAQRLPEILFTGFAASERNALEKYAAESGFQVVKTPTKQFDYLCCGPNAGPAKIEKARLAGAWLLMGSDLTVLVETGELPDRWESNLMDGQS